MRDDEHLDEAGPESNQDGHEKRNYRAEGWPEIVDVEQQAGNSVVPPFPLELLPEPSRTYVADAVRRLSCPADFVAIPHLIGAAAALGAGVKMQPKRYDASWREPAALFGAVVADPGGSKTPGARAGLKPLYSLASTLGDEYRGRLKAWANNKASVEAAKTKQNSDDPPPLEARVVTQGGTMEGIAMLMSEQGNAAPGHLLLHREELPGFFNSLNQYRSGRGDDRQMVLQAYDCGPYHRDTMSSRKTGGLYIKECYLSIYGSLQPKILADLFRHGDADGLTARFGMLAYPDAVTQVEWVDVTPDIAAFDATDARFRELHAIGEIDLRFDDEAQAIFEQWYVSLRNRLEIIGSPHTSFAYHLNKYPGLFARLTSVFHFLEHGCPWPAGTTTMQRLFMTLPPEPRAGVATTRRVRAFIDGYLEPHARRVYGVLDEHPARPGAIKIIGWLRRTRPAQVTARDIRRQQWKEFKPNGNDKSDEQLITGAMNLLDAMNYVRVIEPATGPRGGRPASLPALVNPAIWEKVVQH